MRLLLLLLLTLNLLNAQKIALLIGNSNYQHLDRLTSPSQDIPALAKKLGDMNFEVTELYNLDEKQMKKAIKTFQQKLYHKPNAIALFYYSGHGSQAYGESYLIPIDGDTRDQADVEADGVKVETIARKMATARTKANILFLDACRDVPTGTMGGTKGLGQVNRQPSSTLILYSTSKNKTAKDDRVFNKIVLEKLALNMPFASLANDISYTVGQKTNKQQVPELLSTGLPMLYLNTSSIPLVLKPEIKIIEREKIVYRNKPQEIVVTPNPITIFNNNSSNNKTAVVNGLMFQNEPFSDEDIHNYSSQIESLSNKGRVWNGENAKRYCHELILDGYTNWRLPTRKELLSLSNIQLFNYTNDEKYKRWFTKHKYERLTNIKEQKYFIKKNFLENMPTIFNMKYIVFWTFTKNNKHPFGSVNFKHGYYGWGNPKTNTGYSLCVREIK